MANSTYMDDKFSMMDQSIETLKKSVDDKNIHFSQLMNKLEIFKPRQSSQTPLVNLVLMHETSMLRNLYQIQKFQKEKQSASAATLFVQQLQDIITNTIRAQYDGPLYSSLYYFMPYTRGIDCISMQTTINHQNYNSLMAREP